VTRALPTLLLSALLLAMGSCSAPPASPPTTIPSPSPDWQATITTLQDTVRQERAVADNLRATMISAQTPSPTSTPLPTPTGAIGDDGQVMDAYLRELSQAGVFSGAVLVASRGQVLLRAGYGLADASHALPNTPETRFRLGSITKQFTAMGILILQTRGALNVDDPACHYLSDCPPAWEPITIHQLLTHTSGIPNYTGTPAFAAQEPFPATPEEIIAPLRSRALRFAPGEGYRYSNANYVLLGMIIERVSGASYEDFLRETIFAPLGMRDTGLERARAIIPGRAVGYENPTTEATYLDLSNLFAAGALYSTVDDLYRWDLALAGDRLIPAELRERMFTPVRETYAYGWRITRPFDRLMVGHTGHVSGARTYIARYPDDDAVIIVLSNFESADVTTISLQLAADLFHAPRPTATAATPAPESP
jgi:CubicO group peptidase (beta-lactamase class C family)